MADLTTDFNVTPYHDDYDESKKFYRMLFQPARAVQARELTQLQTIQQKQVQRFGDHVFKNGSIVRGCPITYEPNFAFVRLKNQYNLPTSNNTFDNSLKGYIVAANNGVRAIIREVVLGYEALAPDTNILYVNYIRSGKDGSNNDVSTFSSNQVLSIYDPVQDKFGTLDANNLYNTITTITANGTVNSVGEGYAVTVGEGIIYQKGFFLTTDKLTLIVKKYDQDVDGYVVGFDTKEEIVTNLQDTSLNDPANGAVGYDAPGADRLKLTPTLVSYAANAIPSTIEFFPIVEFDKANPVEQNTDPAYDILGDVNAKRMRETAGDFVSTPFLTEVISASNTDYLEYKVSPGIGYIKGYRVEYIGSRYILANRGTTTDFSNGEIITGSYGKYILVNNVVGVFDHENLQQVNIYDTAQNTIADIETPTSPPSGNIIGTCNIRAFKYESGTKGKSDCQYRLYVFNIKMNSGKSFRDAKSVVADTASSFGKAKADFVLESNKAVIKESENNSLVFPTGLTSLKRLTSNTGVNDTEFIYRDIASATLQANGSAVITLNSPAAGGSERLAFSTVSETNENQFNFVLSNAAFTGNLAGTVTMSGNTITGTGTTFTTAFANGDFIIVNGTNVYNITQVANNTSLRTSTTGTHATANSYARYFQAGAVIDTTSANGSITVNSNTQFTFNMGYANIASGTQTIYASYPVLRTTAVAAKKEIKKNVFVKITPSSNTDKGPWNLGLVDVSKIRAVYVGGTYANTNTDRKAWFTLDNGQNKEFYDHAKLVLKPTYKNNITSASRILVELDHFVSNTSTGAGFYSVDSYPVRPIGGTANSTNIELAEIPFFNGVDLRNAIDFRPSKYNTANSSTTIAGASENPSLANSSFNVPANGQYLIDVDSNFQADVEFYLPRVDILSMTKTGELSVKEGNPSINPKKPVTDNDTMDIAEIYVPAYPSLTPKEARSFNRSDLMVSSTLLTNRGYTMRDIGVLDDRISRLEYYVTLNSLEQKAKDMTIRDENGLDRFKNGIFADPLNDHSIAKVSDIEYKLAIDEQNSIARPTIEGESISYNYSSSDSTNIQRTGNILTLPYTVEKWISQDKASKTRNLTQSVWKWNGNLTLYPEYDNNKDIKELPDINVKLDLTQPWDQFADSPFSKIYGDWRTKVSTNVTETRGGAGTTDKNGTVVGTQITTTTTTKERDIKGISIDDVKKSYNLGSSVTDVSVSPYIASKVIAFVAYGLKPNTRVWAYFDKVPVSAHVAPGSIRNNAVSDDQWVSDDDPSDVVKRTGSYGDSLITDDNGTVAGHFRIPASTFRVGDRIFDLINTDNLVTGYDAITTQASARYTASSISIKTQDTTLNTVTPKLSFTNTTQKITDISVSTKPIYKPSGNTTSGKPTSGGTNGPGSSPGNDQNNNGTDQKMNNVCKTNDPLAESFYVDLDEAATGVCIPRIGVYFKTKDRKLGVTCYIAEMVAGVPDLTKIVAESTLTSAQVSVSNDASVETVFNFTNMPFLTADRWYSFVLQPQANSPEYTAWCSAIGEIDVVSGQQIFSNVFTGVLFVSANKNTWTAIQTEDIKFNMYRARFNQGTGTAVFKNKAHDFFTTTGFTYSANFDSIKAGDIVYAQNTTGGLLLTNTSPIGYVESVDIPNNKIKLGNSNGRFNANTVLQIHRPDAISDAVLNAASTAIVNANTLVANTTLLTIDNFEYNAIVPRFAQIEPAFSSTYYKHLAYKDGFVADSKKIDVEPDVETEYRDTPKYMYSYSNAVAASETTSSEFHITFNSSSSYVSPMIDLKRRSAYVIRNIINNDVTNEHTRYGESLAKYISPDIILQEGQDAEDLEVYVTAYRPVNSEVRVYCKFLHASDPASIEDKVWTLMTSTAKAYSNPFDPTDMIEYRYTVPTSVGETYTAYKNASNSNILRYTDATGAIYDGYKTFAIKVVLTSTNSARVPLLKDIRALALQI